FDDQEGDIIYRVPRRWPVRARVVMSDRLNAAKTPAFNDDVENLRAYADVIEKGPDAPVDLTRNGTDAMPLRAKMDTGQSLEMPQSYGPAWHAWSGGQELAVRKDAMGMMAIDAPAGEHEIRLAFVTPLENRIGRVLTVLTILILAAFITLDGRIG